MKKLFLILCIAAGNMYAVCQDKPTNKTAQIKINVSESEILNEIDIFFNQLKSKYKNIILRRQATTPAGIVIAEYTNPRAENGPKAGKQNKKVEVRIIKEKS